MERMAEDPSLCAKLLVELESSAKLLRELVDGEMLIGSETFHKLTGMTLNRSESDAWEWENIAPSEGLDRAQIFKYDLDTT